MLAGDGLYLKGGSQQVEAGLWGKDRGYKTLRLLGLKDRQVQLQLRAERVEAEAARGTGEKVFICLWLKNLFAIPPAIPSLDVTLLDPPCWPGLLI